MQTHVSHAVLHHVPDSQLILSSWFIQGKLSIGQALLSFLRGVSERTCITPEEYGLELAMTVLEDKVSVTARMSS